MEQSDFEILEKAAGEPRTAIMLIGIHCTGKSFFYHEHLGGMPRVEYDGKIRRRQQQQILNLVDSGMPVVLDSTNITKECRKPVLDLVRNRGYRIVALYFCSVVRECLEKNRGRANAIPDKKIVDMSKVIEIPGTAEGFHSIIYVDNAQNEFRLEVWE